MRVLLVIIVLVLLASFLGWIRYHSGNGADQIILDKAKVQQDAETAAEKVEEFTESARREIHQATDGDDSHPEVEESPVPESVPVR